MIVVAVAGCVEQGSPSTSLAVSATGGGWPPPDDEYVGQQGTLLLGFKQPDVRRFGFALPVTNARVVNGQLVADGLSGQDFIGKSVISFNETVAIEVKIADVIPPATPDDDWQYLLLQPDGSGGWTPACEEPQLVLPSTTPQASPPLAIAMPGRWARDGLYTIAPSWITFACHTGVVAKCDHWQFPVTAVPPDHTENGTPVTVNGADMMQACTRMARADFCSGGVPNTLDGTPIALDDVFRPLPPFPGYTFEGAWTGKAVNDVATTQKPVICLTKKRWSTLPLGGNCPLQLPDPRTDGKGKFCDDLKPEELEAKGALVYSSSTYLDAGLYTYTDPVGTHLTTTSLQPGPAGLPPEWHISPAPPINFPIAGGPVLFEATIFAPELPQGIPDTNLIQLHSYRCANSDLVTTTSDAPAGCDWMAREGHVYLPNTFARAPLRRWWSTAVKRSYTTPIAPTTMIAAGWQLTEIVGAVIRASINVNLRWSAVTGATYTLDVQTRTGEWVAPCVASTTIGSATSFAYRGVCTGASNRRVDHADIIAFRVTARTTTTTTVGTAGYDSVDSDAYVPIAGGKTTAVAITWNDAGPGFTYALDVRPLNGEWVRCITDKYLANGLSHVHTGTCASSGGTIKLQKTEALRVCAAFNHDDKNAVCAETSYDGVASRIALDLPSSM